VSDRAPKEGEPQARGHTEDTLPTLGWAQALRWYALSSARMAPPSMFWTYSYVARLLVVDMGSPRLPHPRPHLETPRGVVHTPYKNCARYLGDRWRRCCTCTLAWCIIVSHAGSPNPILHNHRLPVGSRRRRG
jgi:hypothetical protein